MKSKSQTLQSRKTRSLIGGGTESLGLMGAGTESFGAGCCPCAEEKTKAPRMADKNKNATRPERINIGRVAFPNPCLAGPIRERLLLRLLISADQLGVADDVTLNRLLQIRLLRIAQS